MSNYSKFLLGSPVLIGDNTIPGVKLPKELEAILPKVFKAVRDYGFDYFPSYVEKLTYDEMSEIAAYGGFPVRYPHWKFGAEYNDLQKGYEYGMHKIYEMVINSSPCVIYCLDSNSLLDDITVVAHALGHSDFFKNNIYFAGTNRDAINEFANNGTRIRRYMSIWGKDNVTEFINHVLRLETLVDPANAYKQREFKDRTRTIEREWRHPSRLPVEHDYMESYINTPEWRKKQQQQIEKQDIADQLDIFQEPTKDILRFLRDNAPLKPWEANVLDVLYEEAMYFAPQRLTKAANEGLASWCDHNIIANMGLAGLGQEHESGGIIEYAVHKAGVLGGKHSVNPYKLGFSLLLDIEDRWNKGKFGFEYEECQNLEQKQNWDKQLGLGKEKVFEVRKFCNDFSLINNYFTPEFCAENNYFEYQKYANGDIKIASREFKKIKDLLLKRYLNSGLPQIVLVDNNHQGKGFLFLEHIWDGRPLHEGYCIAVLASIHYLWKNDVYLSTQDADGQEWVYFAVGDTENDVEKMTREQYLKKD